MRQLCSSAPLPLQVTPNICSAPGFVLSEPESTLNTAAVQLSEEKELDDGRGTLYQ